MQWEWNEPTIIWSHPLTNPTQTPLILNLVEEIMQNDFINCNNCKINSKDEV
jgi:hypothetical protein